MNEELVDIVDEEGNFLVTALKGEAHEKGLLHKTVTAEVVDSEGRILLVKQAPGRQDAGQYVFPVGGHVASGETEEETLKRESAEELGITEIFKYEFIGRKIFNRYVIGRQENHFLAMYKIYSDIKPTLNHESESFIYFTKEELKKELKKQPYLFGGSFHFVCEVFFSYLYE